MTVVLYLFRMWMPENISVVGHLSRKKAHICSYTQYCAKSFWDLWHLPKSWDPQTLGEKTHVHPLAQKNKVVHNHLCFPKRYPVDYWFHKIFTDFA